MREKAILVSGVLALLLAGGVPAALWAAAPAIELAVTLDKESAEQPIPTYTVGEPVVATVTASYAGGDPLLVSGALVNSEYYLQLRVVDPAGRVLIVRSDQEHIESPDAPPLPWKYYNGRFFQAAGCQVVEAPFSRTSGPADLLLYYDISLPGYYAVQPQLSVTVFRGAPGEICSNTDYLYKGVVSGEPKYFYVQGSTEGVQVAPDQWRTGWLDETRKAKSVQVHLVPAEGETTGDYLLESVRLNGVRPYRVEGLQPMIKAYFNATQLMQTLGPVQSGQQHTVTISGQHRVGNSYQPFARLQTIKIVN
jgi:hypothetical protein